MILHLNYSYAYDEFPLVQFVELFYPSMMLYFMTQKWNWRIHNNVSYEFLYKLINVGVRCCTECFAV